MVTFKIHLSSWTKVVLGHEQSGQWLRFGRAAFPLDCALTAPRHSGEQQYRVEHQLHCVSCIAVRQGLRHTTDTKVELKQQGPSFLWYPQTWTATFTQVPWRRLHVCTDAGVHVRCAACSNLEAFGQVYKQNIPLNKGNKQALSTSLNLPSHSPAKQCAPNQHSS